MNLEQFLQQKSINSDTTRGLLAGFLGGLAGTAVKSLVETFLPVRKVEQRSAQIKVIDDLSTRITGTPISSQNETLAEQLVSFPLGAGIGAAYGYGKKDDDELRLGDGVILGASTWISTHETSLPLMGLEAKPSEVPLRLQANELLAHVLYGVTTEVVRSYLSKSLNKKENP